MQKVISKQRLAPQEVEPVSKAYPVDQDPQPLNSVCRTSLYDVRLNALPSYALFLPIACVFACASAFLEVYVVSARAHFAVFAVGTYVVFSSYFVADYFLARQSTSYARIPDDKKFYVLSNLIKSAVLTAYTPQAAYLLYQAIHLDECAQLLPRNSAIAAPHNLHSHARRCVPGFSSEEVRSRVAERMASRIFAATAAATASASLFASLNAPSSPYLSRSGFAAA